MSVKAWEKYQPNASSPSPQYPYGSLRQETALGVGDGTPLDVEWGNDFEAFKQTAFSRSGLVPSGNTDTVTNSEMFNAMQDSTTRTLWERSAAESGYKLVAGSFEEGGTLVNANDVLWSKKLNKIFSGTAGFVVAGTNPASGWFVDRSSELIRSQLNRTLLWPDGSPSSAGTVTVDAGKTLLSTTEVNRNTTAVRVEAGARYSGGAVNSADAASGALLAGDAATIDGVNFKGSATNASAVSNAVYAATIEEGVVSGISASDHTSAVVLTNTKRMRVHGITAKALWYQPALVAGGYAVLLQDASESLITDVVFHAKSGDDGRHMLYVSTIGGSKCDNTVFTNAIAKYENKSVQAHSAINVRASRNTLVSNTIVDGANRGISGINANGDILYGLHSSSIVYAEKYADSVTAYGHSFGDAVGGKPIGCLATGLSLRVKPRAGVSGTLCFAKEISGQFQSFCSSVTNVPPASNPIVVKAGADTILINGVLDFIDGGLPSSQAFILFDGACSNITVTGCKTSRPMFRNVNNVTDLTVDYPRRVRVISTSGTLTKVDDDELVSSLAATATQVSVTFNNHVTEKAITNVVTRSTLDFSPPAISCVASITGKVVTLRFFDYAGALINPSTSSVAVDLVINC